MIFQTVMDGTNDVAFRAIRNSTTKTSTVNIEKGTPVMLETTPASANGGWGRQALGSGAAENSLLLGLAHTLIAPDSVGLVQVYGFDNDALVATAGATPGAVLGPNLGTLIAAGTVVLAGGPMMVVLTAPSGAAAQGTAGVFLRCM